MRILGSHNSLSYLRPSSILLWPFHFTARCQGVNIRAQYSLGVRVFDIRLWFDKDGRPLVKHGWITFRCSVEKLSGILGWLNEKGDTSVRLILETPPFLLAPDPLAVMTEKKFYFTTFCTTLINTFKQVKFFGFRDKKTWETILGDRTNDEPVLIDRYSSTTSIFTGKPLESKGWRRKVGFIDDLFPWLFARVWNKKIRKEVVGDILFLDFVDI